MSLFESNKGYLIGVKILDQQHRELMDMVNHLEALGLNKSLRKNAVTQFINALVEYARTHFTTEEEFMRLSKYPNYVAHQNSHKQFITKISQFKSKPIRDFRKHHDSLLAFLKTWIDEHIHQSDKDLGPFLNSRDIF